MNPREAMQAFNVINAKATARFRLDACFCWIEILLQDALQRIASAH